MIDPDAHTAQALVIEGNTRLRALTVAQLRSLGVGRVAQAARAADARRLIEQQSFDIVICARDIEGAGGQTMAGRGSGQDLLDELRREHQLSHNTVFLMSTSRAAYHHVMEAAEALLDGILVRPYSTELLAQRLRDARHRKRELAVIHGALDDGRNGIALAHALARYEKQLPYALYCGRVAAELLLREGRHAQARALFNTLANNAQAWPWARLGVARTHWDSGDEAAACQTLDSMLAIDGACADAHDLLGRIHVDKCEFDPAWQAYRRAAEITPGCLLRTQHAGALAFYQGRRDDALSWLERALALGIDSKLFDALSLMLVALLRHDRGHASGVQQMVVELGRLCSRYPQSPRLKRLHGAAEALQNFRTGGPASAQVPAQTQALALQSLRELSAKAGDEDFDFEAACTVLALWARLPQALCDGAEHTALLQRVALRFSVSRAIAEVLMAVASGTQDDAPNAADRQRSERTADTVRDCQARISMLSEQALEQAMAGNAMEAAQGLLAEGEMTLNAKLLQLAAAIAGRHASGQAGSVALQSRAQDLLQRSCKAANHIAGIHRSGRSPGGMQLRGPTAAVPAAVALAAAPEATGA